MRAQKADTNTVLLSIRRGTTLVELMVSAGFLGVGAVALLACVNAAVTNGNYARRRAVILADAENVIDATRAAASMGTIQPGVSAQAVNVAGMETSVTITETITLQAGYTDLYLVDVSAAWNEHSAVGAARADSIVLDTYIKTHDT
ncbi:MAG: type IV pilus modification PilV family protein [Fimbriimonadaceae bacterium]